MRNVVITGGSRGIGAACAEKFAENGDRVFIIYEKNDTAAKAVAEKCGAIPIKADISAKSGAEIAEKAVHEACGGVDVLINNAGIAQIKMFCDITEADWDRMFDVNMKSAYLMTQSFLPDMVSRKRGKIINISSMWGQAGASCEVHYSASKAAVIGFTKALAKELAPSGICVNCVCPGVIETEMNSMLDAETKATLREEIPVMRTGDAREVAESVFFLSSAGADYVTGQILGVNGGMVI